MIDDETLKDVLASTFSCTICGDEDSLVVDHDHKTNKIRGLLCNRCNKGLGLFRDDPNLLEFARVYVLASQNDEEAAQYVKEHSGLDLYGGVQ
jgi:transcription elongation factor Elf1